MKSRIQNFVVALGVIALLVACGSGSAREASAKNSSSAGTSNISEGPLPSSRRLESFLPEKLNDWRHTIKHGGQLRKGRSQAKRQYLPGTTDFNSGIELEISFYRMQLFNRSLRFFNTGLGKHVEIAGNDAAIDEKDEMGFSEFDIHMRITEELWVEASGQGPYERIRDAALAVDLSGLVEALEDGSLFEELEGDRLERTLLDKNAVEDLLPEKLGELKRSSSEGRTFFNNEPMHSRARGQYGSGTLTIYDYGKPENARGVESKIEENAVLAGFKHHTECVVRRAPLTVEDGLGEWAWTENVKAPLQPALVVHLVRGRFVLQYAGLFVLSQPLPDRATPRMRAQADQLNRETGADTFGSIEEQRDAILSFFEALDLAQPNH